MLEQFSPSQVSPQLSSILYHRNACSVVDGKRRDEKGAADMNLESIIFDPPQTKHKAWDVFPPVFTPLMPINTC